MPISVASIVDVFANSRHDREKVAGPSGLGAQLSKRVAVAKALEIEVREPMACVHTKLCVLLEDELPQFLPTLFDRAGPRPIEHQLPEHGPQEPQQGSQATSVHEVAGRMPPVDATESPDWVLRNPWEPWTPLKHKTFPSGVHRHICVRRIRPVRATKPAEVVRIVMWKLVLF